MRGLLVGRFQPFHSGHLGLVRRIRADAPSDELVLAIGSAEQSYTPENPFTASERYEMIARALAEAGVAGVVAIPVPDIHRHSLWVGYLEGLLPPFRRVYTNNPLTRLLFEKAGYAVESPELIDRGEFEGKKIRARLAAGEPLGGTVPPAVAAC
ncbi:MAG: nicotinamide-nucleotide adenylyltransferase, partial [Thermoplasmata archaeon]